MVNRKKKKHSNDFAIERNGDSELSRYSIPQLFISARCCAEFQGFKVSKASMSPPLVTLREIAQRDIQ